MPKLKIKKTGRPKSKNVPYFPHFTESPSELKFLEKRFGSDGYKAYYRIFELLTKTDDHHIKLQTENQKLTFQYEINVDQEILSQVIDYLLEMNVIDNEMWEEKQIIWVDGFVDAFKGAYYKRGRTAPKKVGNEIVSDTRNEEYSRVEKSREIRVSREDVSKTTTDLDKVINDLKETHTELDIDKSLTKLKNYNREYNADDVIKWVSNDLANGWNIKQPEFEKTSTGVFKAYCSKCGKKDILGNKAGVWGYSDCCHAEYLPAPLLKNVETLEK